MCAAGDGSAAEQGAASVRAPDPEVVISVEAREQVVRFCRPTDKFKDIVSAFSEITRENNTDFPLTKFEMLSLNTVICNTDLMGRMEFFLGE